MRRILPLLFLAVLLGARAARGIPVPPATSLANRQKLLCGRFTDAGFDELSAATLHIACEVHKPDNHRPDCVLRQGVRYAVQSNLTFGLLHIPPKTVVEYADCGPNAAFRLSAEHIIVDGTLRAGREGDPYDSKLNITLRAGDEIIYGDVNPPLPAGMAAYKGNFGIIPEVENPASKFIGVRPGGTLDLHGLPKLPWTRISRTAAKGQRHLCLSEKAAQLAWLVGDELALAPTNYRGYDQAERARIAKIDDASADCAGGTKISLDRALAFDHYGDALADGEDPRMRAEVANLNRNVLLWGALDDIAKDPQGIGRYGMHTLFLYNSTVRLDNVEVANGGQEGHMARYPVHWHLAGHSAGSYMKNSSVHDSFQRCVSLHGSWGALEVRDNSCFDITGHAVYWENGIEVNTVVKGNLVMLVRPGQLLCSDNGEGYYTDENFNRTMSTGGANEGPSAFWILNGNNIIEDNVAVAVGKGPNEGIGYWLVVPQFIMSPSYEFFGNATVQRLLNVPPEYPTQNPTEIPMLSFKNNVAHSMFTGFKADGILRSAGNDPGSCVKESAGVWNPKGENRFDGYFAWKNQVGLWINSENAVFKGMILSDNVRGAYIEKIQVNQLVPLKRASLPTCYPVSGLAAMELCYPAYAAPPEEPGSFIRFEDTVIRGRTANQAKFYESPCASYATNPENADCLLFGQVGVMMSMGYAYFEGVTASGYGTGNGMNYGLFGHKEDPGYNVGPFYVSNVTYLDGSNPVFMDDMNQSGMFVRMKAGALNSMLHSPDGTLANPRIASPELKAIVAQRSGITIAPKSPSMVDARWEKRCYCPPEYGYACACPGDMRSIFVEIMAPFAEPFKEQSTFDKPDTVDSRCKSLSRNQLNSSWGTQHGCLQDTTTFASGADLGNKFLMQWAGGSVLGSTSVNGTLAIHPPRRLLGHPPAFNHTVSFAIKQLGQHPDMVQPGDFWVGGIVFPPDARVNGVYLNFLSTFLDTSSLIERKFDAQPCSDLCKCCPIPGNTISVTRPTYAANTLPGSLFYPAAADPSKSRDGTVQVFNKAGLFPREASSYDALVAGPPVGWFVDRREGRTVLWAKFGWTAQAVNATAKPVFPSDPTLSFFVNLA
ncbi:hypothetical protein DFJ74DRAFT_421536 [Hyaloraphidium curvatum]|nr:hypothetical protein DFJ74DRAFT_421536 [Hyaloraphidium curvatum]